jgi:predicted nucleic acid-binding protein
MTAVDTNVLVYAHREDSVWSAAWEISCDTHITGLMMS